MIFSGPITSFSCFAGGIFTAPSTAVYAFNAGGTQIGTAAAAGAATTQQLLMGSLSGATEVVMTIGDFGDWVGMDNLEFTAVPEPVSMVTIGLGLAAMARRRAKKS
jgi:hypothetical protein